MNSMIMNNNKYQFDSDMDIRHFFISALQQFRVIRDHLTQNA